MIFALFVKIANDLVADIMSAARGMTKMTLVNKEKIL